MADIERKLDSNNHSVFLMYYHLVLVIKYRKKVLDDPISIRAKEIFEYIAPKYNITLQEWNHDQDHLVQRTSEFGIIEVYQCL
jgi:putative transposase